MRKTILILLTLSTLCLATQSYALKLPFFSKKNDKISQQKAQKILMYAEPNTGKVIAKLAPNTRLIPIFKKGEWTKVGNPANGKVGWVNRQQVRKVREAFYRPDIQTIYINRDQNKSGKPEVNIIAYKNGKRLSPAEAKKLYEKIRAQQEKQMKAMRRMTRNMNRMMSRQFYYDDKLFDSFWNSEPWIEPVIVFPEPRQNLKSDSASKGDELES